MSKRKDGQERGKYTLEFKLEANRYLCFSRGRKASAHAVSNEQGQQWCHRNRDGWTG